MTAALSNIEFAVAMRRKRGDPDLPVVDSAAGGDVILVYGAPGETDVLPFYDHVFETIADGEVLRFTKEGEIHVHGEAVIEDKEFVTEFFRHFRGCLIDGGKSEPEPGNKCTWSPGHGWARNGQAAPDLDGRVRFADKSQQSALQFDWLCLENGRILSRGDPIRPHFVPGALRRFLELSQS